MNFASLAPGNANLRAITFTRLCWNIWTCIDRGKRWNSLSCVPLHMVLWHWLLWHFHNRCKAAILVACSPPLLFTGGEGLNIRRLCLLALLAPVPQLNTYDPVVKLAFGVNAALNKKNNPWCGWLEQKDRWSLLEAWGRHLGSLGLEQQEPIRCKKWCRTPLHAQANSDWSEFAEEKTQKAGGKEKRNTWKFISK